MLNKTKLTNLQEIIKEYSNEEIIWFQGYLEGILNNHLVTIKSSDSLENVQNFVKPCIIYGTETGNSKKIATQLLTNFKKNKIQAKSYDVAQYPLDKLAKEEFVILIFSTQGDGELPQNSVDFYENFKNNIPNLEKTKFAVFALGDSSYPLFCEGGKMIRNLFLEANAIEVLEMVTADLDYKNHVENWQNKLLDILKNSTKGAKPTSNSTISISEPTAIKKYYQGVIKNSVILNDLGSNKNTYHIEISAENLQYEPGDSLGIYAQNSEKEVLKIINYFNENAERKIEFEQKEQTLKEILKDKNISFLSKNTIQQIAKVLNVELVTDKTDLFSLLSKIKSKEITQIETIIALLLPNVPRLYSISSALEAHEDEVHITVNHHQFVAEENKKNGLASSYLSTFEKGEEINFYIHPNSEFRLPAENTDIIMIGPGTGIAPFRSFLSDRDAKGAEGKNWLFFGEQHFALDFYYQTEIQEWLSTGLLTNFDAAFSRDQKNKIYVQDRIKEKSKEINDWLENGAHLYICGQKYPMSNDVEEALAEVLIKERKIDLSQAREILENLELEGRFVKDVY
jgi:sulfite reductase (NADPH) flavoprotein alpha-component